MTNTNSSNNSSINLNKISEDCLLILPKNSGLEEYRKTLETLSNEKVVVRAEDVPFFVEKLLKQGTKCVGLTGEDLFLEYKSKNKESKLSPIQNIEWTDKTAIFQKPALCLLGKGKLTKESVVAINNKYTSIAEQYFSKTIQPKSKLYFSGATESAYKYGLADFVIDIVYSGTSAKEVGLQIIDKIMESNIVLLGVRE